MDRPGGYRDKDNTILLPHYNTILFHIYVGSKNKNEQTNKINSQIPTNSWLPEGRWMGGMDKIDEGD